MKFPGTQKREVIAMGVGPSDTASNFSSSVNDDEHGPDLPRDSEMVDVSSVEGSETNYGRFRDGRTASDTESNNIIPNHIEHVQASNSHTYSVFCIACCRPQLAADSLGKSKITITSTAKTESLGKYDAIESKSHDGTTSCDGDSDSYRSDQQDEHKDIAHDQCATRCSDRPTCPGTNVVHAGKKPQIHCLVCDKCCEYFYSPSKNPMPELDGEKYCQRCILGPVQRD